MATLVAYSQLVGSTEEGVDGIQMDRAVNGTVKVRSFFSGRKRKWKLKHLLTGTELNALLSFYDTNRVAENTFTWTRDATAYTVFFDGPPQYTIEKPGTAAASLFNVTVSLVQK